MARRVGFGRGVTGRRGGGRLRGAPALAAEAHALAKLGAAARALAREPRTALGAKARGARIVPATARAVHGGLSRRAARGSASGLPESSAPGARGQLS